MADICITCAGTDLCGSGIPKRDAPHGNINWILFVREKTTWQIRIEEKCNEVLLEQLEGRDDLQSITGQVSYIEELPLPQTVKDKLMENNNTEN